MLRIPKNKLLSLQLHVGPTKSELPEKKKKNLVFQVYHIGLGIITYFTLSMAV